MLGHPKEPPIFTLVTLVTLVAKVKMATRITMVKMIGTSPRIRCGSNRDIKISHFLEPFHTSVSCTFTRHNFVNINIAY